MFKPSVYELILGIKIVVLNILKQVLTFMMKVKINRNMEGTIDLEVKLMIFYI